MKNKKDVVDLVQSSDGTYVTKGAKSTTVGEPQKTTRKKNANMEQFFEGIDTGLDFVEGMAERVNRMLNLRG